MEHANAICHSRSKSSVVDLRFEGNAHASYKLGQKEKFEFGVKHKFQEHENRSLRGRQKHHLDSVPCRGCSNDIE